MTVSTSLVTSSLGSRQVSGLKTTGSIRALSILQTDAEDLAGVAAGNVDVPAV